MNVQSQAEIYIKRISERKRSPVKPATLAAYNSYLRNWILPRIGTMEVSAVENGVMRKLVSEMADTGKSASMIAGVEQCIKGIVASAIDANGNKLYPRDWNQEFIDAPIVDPDSQKAPIITQLELNRAISRAESHIRPLIILLAASGLRISEALALKGQPSRESSFYDPDRHVLVIRKALYKGQEQPPKTSAGVREVDLPMELDIIPQTDGYVFKTTYGSPLDSTSRFLRDAADRAGIPGFHSLRRFRRTHLEASNVPAGLCDFWMGHQGKGMAGRYVKIGSDIQARKQWAEKAGLGFEL